MEHCIESLQEACPLARHDAEAGSEDLPRFCRCFLSRGGRNAASTRGGAASVGYVTNYRSDADAYIARAVRQAEKAASRRLRVWSMEAR